ncbi:MAG: hypothetical protein IJW00_02455 [Clostridia bacterium]|nr:hypothetical protein [Clostridia bacterium]
MAQITIQEILLAAEQDEAMTELAHRYNLFIIRTASATCRRFITKHDDEYAIALRAFCDAVKKYDPEAGVSFESYAKLLIKNRVIDHLRNESRHMGHLSIEDEMENGRDFSDDTEREQAETQSAAAEEIARLSTVIAAYGIAFNELPEASPKHQKTREACAQAVAYMLRDPALIADMRRNHFLPMKILQEKCDIPRKTLERHRKYIVTATEVCLGDFPVIAEYLKHIVASAEEPKN